MWSKWRLNGVILWMRPEKLRSHVTANVTFIKIPSCSKALSAQLSFCSSSLVMMTSLYQWNILERDVKLNNQSILVLHNMLRSSRFVVIKSICCQCCDHGCRQETLWHALCRSAYSSRIVCDNEAPAHFHSYFLRNGASPKYLIMILDLY
jgi:hypothetical protein